MTRSACLVVVGFLIASAAACGKKPAPPVVTPGPAPTPAVTTSGPPPPAPTPPATPPTVPPEAAISGSPYRDYTVEDWNDPAKSPLKPVFFELDSDQIDDRGRQVLQENAKLMKEHPTLVITVEGHCDERGTPEYNLALGERRALATKSFLVSLGIGGERLQTVSYGKEFPFDAGHSEESWWKNRRAHFMVTKK